ncbi:DUF4167 domain-containing protein [Sneathiella marina]|uniref:DUF4167 domain-containing protein n=1 Tax=Sneathiella marina TaxID=2950108 RepID=A0ABY4W0T0_9PROT|nr:DUF4167 domain-containing protein [Sneathiella marina]USG60693.1 DUF4167 domain-containing protein [Sneathiella marina]
MRVSSNRRPRGGRTNSGNNRSGGNSGRSNNNNNRRSSNGNRNYDSNGPDGKIRGTALQVYDKYIAVATDAQTSGDRVAAENYFQHAEHYFRIVAANNAAKQEKMSEQQAQANSQDSGNKDSSQAQGNSNNSESRNSPVAAESENTGEAPASLDLSTAEQPVVDLSAEVQSDVTVTSDITATVNDEAEAPKRKTSRTRTLRRRTSNRATQKDDSEQIDPVD